MDSALRFDGDQLAYGPPADASAHSAHALLATLLAGATMTRRQVREPKLLIFDSGLGGLTVFAEVAKARPDADYVYVADDALFPYGAIEARRLVERVCRLMGELIERHRPDLVVIACNTASTIVLPELRRRFDVPFVGTVPAIKPACAHSRSRRVSVLGTEATVRREYTHSLIRQFAQGCQVTLCGSAHLASYAERELAGNPVPDAAIAAELAPCFVEDAQARTDTIVLACTHYPLLRARFEALAPWPVHWLDPAPAIARRVVSLIGEPAGRQARGARAFFTSGKRPQGVLARAMEGFGLALDAAVEPRPAV